MKDLISNCFLCEEKALHVAGAEEAQVMQCISCGYTTSTKYIGTKETNEEFQKLGKDMKNWAIEKNDRIWIPTVIALPIGMLYPISKTETDDISEASDKLKLVMKWSFAPMIKIPEEERKNFPNEVGGFYDKKVDTDNAIVYDVFLNGMSYINELMKQKAKDGE
tara:strand:+ start:1679 stop:2170 length:492 start_codon:yes stop_codon:yes gene_type:complete